MIDPKTLPYLPVTEGNHLVLVDSKTTQKKGMDNDDDYYHEVNARGEVVAKYHVWHHLNIYPPQKVDEGWVKFDAEGKLISKGSTM